MYLLFTCNSTPCTLMSLNIRPVFFQKDNGVDVFEFIFYTTISLLYAMTIELSEDYVSKTGD